MGYVQIKEGERERKQDEVKQFFPFSIIFSSRPVPFISISE